MLRPAGPDHQTSDASPLQQGGSTADMAAMPEPSPDVARMLADLEAEERALSLRRLHERIAFYPETTSEELHRQERALSDKRRKVQARIDALRGVSDRLTLGDEAA